MVLAPVLVVDERKVRVPGMRGLQSMGAYARRVQSIVQKHGHAGVVISDGAHGTLHEEAFFEASLGPGAIQVYGRAVCVP
jgi:hypothetical protein